MPADPNSKGGRHFTYGFGLRICAGRHVANNTLFIHVTRVLWTCTIEPMRNVHSSLRVVQYSDLSNLMYAHPINLPLVFARSSRCLKLECHTNRSDGTHSWLPPLAASPVYRWAHHSSLLKIYICSADTFAIANSRTPHYVYRCSPQ
jgi:hypothetical protein